MKIVVTGATGALGSRVVEALLKSVPANQVAVSVRDRFLEVQNNDLEKLLQRPVTLINEALNKLILSLNK